MYNGRVDAFEHISASLSMISVISLRNWFTLFFINLRRRKKNRMILLLLLYTSRLNHLLESPSVCKNETKQNKKTVRLSYLNWPSCGLDNHEEVNCLRANSDSQRLFIGSDCPQGIAQKSLIPFADRHRRYSDSVVKFSIAYPLKKSRRDEVIFAYLHFL